MSRQQRAIVTGAFSNLGSAVAAVLLARGWEIATLTNRDPAPGDDDRIERHPLRFEADSLASSLEGADLFINTYWIRFPYRGLTFDHAVANIAGLITACEAAGAGRFVQVGVSNASLDSDLGYYRGKARVDELVRSSTMSHAIVRPTLVVGSKDVLTNNMAWFLRRFPLIAVPRGEGYELQPITIGDAARIIADAAEAREDIEVDAAGPERMQFRAYLELLARVLGRHVRFVDVPPRMMVASLAVLGAFLRDVILTREELAGLRQNLLVSHSAPLGGESVSAWLQEHGRSFGSSYVNDTRYRFRNAL